LHRQWEASGAMNPLLDEPAVARDRDEEVSKVHMLMFSI
jgi:hypothetical protein